MTGNSRMMTLEADFTFSAAHHLPMYEGPCKRMHGHNYKLRVSLRGPVGSDGMVYDFLTFSELVKKTVVDKCDHHTLNDFITNPTAENTLLWMWQELKAILPEVVELRLWETDNLCAVYRG